LHKLAVADAATPIHIISIHQGFQLALRHVHLMLMHQSHEVLFCQVALLMHVQVRKGTMKGKTGSPLKFLAQKFSGLLYAHVETNDSHVVVSGLLSEVHGSAETLMHMVSISPV